MDWAGLLRLGLRRLSLSPQVFWSLTPIELIVMLGIENTRAPLTRDKLNALSAAFPDDIQGENDG